MVVLDTDILTLVQRTSDNASNVLQARLDASSERVCVSIISIEEQMRGWLAWIARAKTPVGQIDAYARFRALLDDYHRYDILDFDSLAAGEYQHLRHAKIRIGTMDLRIAAIALSQDALLLSRNLADFQKVPGLRVEDWTR